MTVERPKITCLLLAAGQSSRMAPLDKLTLPIDGKPLIRHVAQTVLDAGFDRILCVLPDAGFDNRIEAIKDLQLDMVRCPTAHEGMGASIAFGISQLKDNPDGVMIALADMPNVTNMDIAAVLKHWSTDAIVALGTNGMRGNPVLFGRTHLPALKALTGDVGAKDHQDKLFLCEAEHADALADIDTPVDRDLFLKA